MSSLYYQPVGMQDGAAGRHLVAVQVGDGYGATLRRYSLQGVGIALKVSGVGLVLCNR